jgi:hypothetical protein
MRRHPEHGIVANRLDAVADDARTRIRAPKPSEAEAPAASLARRQG